MGNKALHPVQSKLLDLLIINIDDPLTIREIQEALGLSSTSVVAHHLTQLEKKGLLKRNPNYSKDYQILSNSPEKRISYLNLYGMAQCGPNGSLLDGSPIDRIPVSTRLIPFPAAEAFMVKARGRSMQPKINDGDLVIARKTNNIDNEKIVVCVNNGEVLIKKVRKEKNNIILISLNQSFPPFLANRSFRVEGEVRSIISNKIY